jgi:hypothetical protein
MAAAFFFGPLGLFIGTSIMLSEEQAARQRRLEKMRDSVWRKRRFLDELAERFDVDAACAAAELCWRDMCTLRDEDPEFAAEWERVIEGGYERIEIMLLRLGGAAAKGEADADVELARELLKQRASAKRRPARGASPKPPPGPTREQRIASIMRKVLGPAARAGKKGKKHGTDTPVGRMAGVAKAHARQSRGGRAKARPGAQEGAGAAR